MSDKPDDDSKTEEPTEKRIRDSVEKGETPTSKEVGVLASLIAFCAYYAFAGKEMIQSQAFLLARVFEHSATLPIGTPVDASAILQHLGMGVGALLLPLMAMFMVAGIIAGVSQNEPRMVGNRVAPKISRISLIGGWKRIFGKKGFVEFLKSIAKLAFATGCVALMLAASVRHIFDTMFQHPSVMMQEMSSTVFNVFIAVALAMTAIAAFDLFWSRYSWYQDMKMTKQEIKDEHKQAEGDPIVKARMRSLARDRAQRRMMSAVPTATLIIANPTHFAVALRYENGKDDAPVVVAKGADKVALRIRALGEDNSVPVFEQVELARGLYKAVQVDQVIPPEFFQAVAELIRVIYAKSE